MKMLEVVIGEMPVWKDVQRESSVKCLYGKLFKEVSGNHIQNVQHDSISHSLLHRCTNVKPARLYLSRCTSRMTRSFKACSTVAQVHSKPDSVPEGLLQYCAGVHLAGFNLWELFALLYRYKSSMTHSQKVCCTRVPLWLLGLKACCTLDRYTSSKTQSLNVCSTIVQVYILK